MQVAVLALMRILLDLVRTIARSRAELIIENLALRQQVAALKRERPRPSTIATSGATQPEQWILNLAPGLIAPGERMARSVRTDHSCQS